jgi:release factor glutamine methyltransferase
LTAVTENDQWTIRRILEWTAGHLQRQGIETPRLDAEILLAHARGCQRIELYTRYDHVLTDDERRVMRELVQRRARREPVAYLVGHREFFSLDFQVTPDVLIPRPDTETLVLELLELAKPITSPRILDVGTGSGCIAVTAAVNRPDAKLTATDVSTAALEVARTNATRHHVIERIRLLHGDLFAPLNRDQPFDVIASNPPYVADGEWETLAADVRLHEPRGALTAGPDGLDVIRRLIAEAADFLVPGGHLLLEIDISQADAVEALLSAETAFNDVRLINDLTARPRVAHGRRAFE